MARQTTVFEVRRSDKAPTMEGRAMRTIRTESGELKRPKGNPHGLRRGTVTHLDDLRRRENLLEAAATAAVAIDAIVEIRERCFVETPNLIEPIRWWGEE